MHIDDIKRHGAILGLEAELNIRIRNLTDAQTKRQWTTCHSHSVVIGQLTEELRKLEDQSKKS